ncbi:MAG: glycoside hydrolase family 15 protein [Patescibacteria group bacterium]
MARSIVLGNGETLVALDKFGRVRDFYFPRIGLENQIGNKYLHKIGVLIGRRISWFGEDKNWDIKIKSEEDALISNIEACNKKLEIQINFKDLVHSQGNIFLRNIEIANNSKKNRQIKIYFTHKFKIGNSNGESTTFFDPKKHSIIHYKGQRVFMINGEMEGGPFTDYEIGSSSPILQKNDNRNKKNINYGKSESLIGFDGLYQPNESKKINYWIVGARSIPEAQNLNDLVFKETPEHIVKSTSLFWNDWVNKGDFNFHKLEPKVISLFKKSLMIIRSHVDKGGAIISSADSDTLNQGKDTYAYMWPRDAVFSAIALDKTGDNNVSKKFFEFCKTAINAEGYLMHKYLPDKSLGSSWHPYIEDGQYQLPIQEDETAVVVWALYEHYKIRHDIEFIESLYNELIEKTADFMVKHRDVQFKLPKSSYDLWEEKFGISTYTSSAVYGALMAAAEFSRLLGKVENAKLYKDTALEIKKGILNHLYDKSSCNFLKLMICHGNNYVEDKTIDISSVFGVFLFGVLPVNDIRLERAMNQTVGSLSNNIRGLGIARYFGDNYCKVQGNIPGNPWLISTLWFVQFLISKAQSEKEFSKIREYFDWVAKCAQASGILSQQLNPFNGEQVSISPLIWSHAEFVNTVIKYLERLEELGVCKIRKQ